MDPIMLEDNEKFIGTKSSALTIFRLNQDDATINMPDDIQDYYFCLVKGLCSEGIPSNPILLRMAPELYIVQNPSSSQICAGEAITLNARAISSDPSFVIN